MRERRWVLTLGVLLLTTSLSGCLDSGEDESNNQLTAFPHFDTVAENEEQVTLTDYKGAPFAVVFSAEWCTSPCHRSMHALNSTLQAPPVLVISTDPAENPQGVTLAEWKESADRHDDERNETTGEIIDSHQTLDFRFIKGAEIATQLGVQSPGTVMFVNAEGEIVAEHVGVTEDPDLILGYWSDAGGTAPE